MRVHGLMVFCLLPAALSGEPAERGSPIIPRPTSFQVLAGVCAVSAGTRIHIRRDGADLGRVARLVSEGIAECSGLSLRVDSIDGTSGARPGILLALDKGMSLLGEEGYELSVRPNGITLSAAHETGLLRGSQSLLQLLSLPEPGGGSGDTLRVPCARVVDRPRFAWRGLLLDCGRHFMRMEVVKRTIDLLALYKMNILHWHLTEDQGWRLEIRRYPRLTEIGAWRRYDDGTIEGGFYTQDEVREIVRYAGERGITVVPEIEMPGHCVAALASYPQYSCTGGPFRVQTEWGVHRDVYCAGNDSTFAFLENILSEVMELFPSRYLHVGGDEVPRDRWSRCERCQRRIREEGLKGEEELQSYFLRRVERFLNAHGRRLVGWDEILEGGLAPNATVQSWRGMGGAVAAVRGGHDAIVSPSDYTYLNRPVRSLDLKTVYSFEPFPPGLSRVERDRILGGEACLWSEYATDETLQEQLLPRLLALAEILWSGRTENGYEEFSRRVGRQYALLERMGIRVGATSSAAVRFAPLFDAGSRAFSLRMSSDLPGAEIRYTLSGAPPDGASPLYAGELSVSGEVPLRAALFTGGRRMSEVWECNLSSHEGVGSSVLPRNPFSVKYPGAGITGLTDGVRGSLDYQDGCWQGYEGEDLDATIDFGRVIVPDSVTVSCLQTTGVWIFLPLSVAVELSADGKTFAPLGIVRNDLSPAQTGPLVKVFTVRGDGRPARYLRVVAKNRALCPPGHPGAGGKCWVFADEIVVRGKFPENQERNR